MATTGEYRSDKRSYKEMIFAMGLCVVIILITIGIYIFDSMNQKHISQLEADISSLNADIQAINEETSIQLYAKVKNNKGVLDKYRAYSNIPSIVKHLNETGESLKTQFSGFSYSKGVVQTKASTRSTFDGAGGTAWKNVKNFFEYFRSGQDTYFNLGFVNSFSGESPMEYSVTLTLK